VKERVAKVLEIVRLVTELGEYDSNVIGMAAEIIAEEDFGMTKVHRGKKGIDGRWIYEGSDRTVQVKAWSEARVRRYKASSFLRINDAGVVDDLLVLLIHSSEPKYQVLYKGPITSVGYREEKWARRVIQFGSTTGMMPNEKAKAIVAALTVASSGAVPSAIDFVS
jgi:hypothetical protein